MIKYIYYIYKNNVLYFFIIDYLRMVLDEKSLGRYLNVMSMMVDFCGFFFIMFWCFFRLL